MDRQIQAALTVITSNSGEGGDIERKLAGALRGLGDSHFVTLYGSYNIWQEVRLMCLSEVASVSRTIN